MQRKQAAGKSYREALRCLKRHLARVVFKTMVRAEQARATIDLDPVSIAAAA